MSALAKGALFSVLIFLAPVANAEYYLECHKPVFNVVTIKCKGHHCQFRTQHGTRYNHVNYHPRVKYCDLDRATGDDNPCRYPDLQIN